MHKTSVSSLSKMFRLHDITFLASPFYTSCRMVSDKPFFGKLDTKDNPTEQTCNEKKMHNSNGIGILRTFYKELYKKVVSNWVVSQGNVSIIDKANNDNKYEEQRHRHSWHKRLLAWWYNTDVAIIEEGYTVSMFQWVNWSLLPQIVIICVSVYCAIWLIMSANTMRAKRSTLFNILDINRREFYDRDFVSFVEEDIYANNSFLKKAEWRKLPGVVEAEKDKLTGLHADVLNSDLWVSEERWQDRESRMDRESHVTPEMVNDAQKLLAKLQQDNKL